MASKRAQRRRQEHSERKVCTSKTAYSTMAEAAAKARQSRGHSGESIYAYKCPFAEHFHIGHRDITNMPPKELAEKLKRYRKSRQN